VADGRRSASFTPVRIVVFCPEGNGSGASTPEARIGCVSQHAVEGEIRFASFWKMARLGRWRGFLSKGLCAPRSADSQTINEK
jgi:hypothetical protein